MSLLVSLCVPKLKSMRLRRKTEVFVYVCVCKMFCPITQSAGPITPCQKHTASVVGLWGGSHSTVRPYQVTLPRHAYYNKGTRKLSVCVVTSKPVEELDKYKFNFLSVRGDL